MEYKRQVHQANSARLMSYRLDQGHGVCIYRLGVEDDGCHSLMDHPTIQTVISETWRDSMNPGSWKNVYITMYV
jgi:GTPase